MLSTNPACLNFMVANSDIVWVEALVLTGLTILRSVVPDEPVFSA